MPDGSSPPTSPVMFYADRYGSYAFGVASLLLIWFVIVQPEMQASRITFQEHQQLMNEVRTTIQSLQEVSKDLKDLVERTRQTPNRPGP